MEENDSKTAVLEPKPGVKIVLREAGIVVVAGLVFALVANAVSPRGLMLSRNYFPGTEPGQPIKADAPSLTPNTNASPQAATNFSGLLAARLQAQGLQLVNSNQMAQLFGDPRYGQEQIVFIDARDAQHYEAGHIPGAYEFDRYHAENYFAAVLPACLAAEEIVVYCTGGDCEDSEYTALTLRDAGIPKEKLFVYAGGMTEWNRNGLPVEVGGRNSGKLTRSKP